MVQDVRGLAPGSQILGGDALPPDQDLAVRSQPDLLSGEGASQGAALRSKGVVHGDHGTALGETVPLEQREPKFGPPLFLPQLQPGAAHDDGPELPAQRPVHLPVLPPTGGHSRQPTPLHRPPGNLDAPAQPPLQAGQDPGHRNQDRDPMPADAVQDRAWMELGHEHHAAPQDEGNEESGGLTEHVAQGQEIQEPDGLERSGVFPVAGDLTGEGSQVGANVPVAVDDPLGRARGAGREDDLHRVVRFQPDLRERLTLGLERGQIPERQAFHAGLRMDLPAVHQQARLDLVLDPLHQRRAGAGVHRNDLHSLGNATPECDDPLRFILSPEKKPVSPPDAPFPEMPGEGGDAAPQVGIGEDAGAEAVVETNRFTGPPLQLGDQVEKGPHRRKFRNSRETGSGGDRGWNRLTTWTDPSPRRLPGTTVPDRSCVR